MLRSRHFFVRCVPAAVSLQTVCILFSLVAVTISSLQIATAASKFLQSREPRGEYNSKLGNADEAGGRGFGRGGGGSGTVDYAQTKAGGTPSGGEQGGKAPEAKAADAAKATGQGAKADNAVGKTAEGAAKPEPPASGGGPVAAKPGASAAQVDSASKGPAVAPSEPKAVAPAGRQDNQAEGGVKGDGVDQDAHKKDNGEPQAEKEGAGKPGAAGGSAGPPPPANAGTGAQNSPTTPSKIYQSASKEGSELQLPASVLFPNRP